MVTAAMRQDRCIGVLRERQSADSCQHKKSSRVYTSDLVARKWEQAVDLFYDRVLADDQIKHFFDQVDTKRLRDKQRNFLTYACGGPVTYDSGTLRETHRHMDLEEEHFAAVVGHLKSTLEELAVADHLVEEVVAIANATRDDVLGL